MYSVFDETPGSTDDQILDKACAENWVLITNDKDFGELVYREKLPHRGVVFMRLSDERSAVKIAVLSRLLLACADRLPDSFVVVTETHVRFSVP